MTGQDTDTNTLVEPGIISPELLPDSPPVRGLDGTQIRLLGFLMERAGQENGPSHVSFPDIMDATDMPSYVILEHLRELFGPEIGGIISIAQGVNLARFRDAADDYLGLPPETPLKTDVRTG